MNFDRTEVLYLTEEDWGHVTAANPTPQEKGNAIDYAIKRMFGGASGHHAPFDMKFPIDGCTYHEVKSSTTKWLKISPTEIEHAEWALSKGDDTLFWAIEQLEARDEYRLFAVAKFSKFHHRLQRSEYDLYNVKRGEAWVEEPGYFINKYVMAEYAEV
jgi:hypothetical protein